MKPQKDNRPPDQAPLNHPIKLEDLVPSRNVQGGKGKPTLLFGSLPSKRRNR